MAMFSRTPLGSRGRHAALRTAIGVMAEAAGSRHVVGVVLGSGRQTSARDHRPHPATSASSCCGPTCSELSDELMVFQVWKR